MGLRVDEETARNPDHALIWGTTSTRGKLRGVLGDVLANDREVTVIQFPNVRAAIRVTAQHFSTPQSRSNSAHEHDQYVNIRKYVVNSLCTYNRRVGIETESRAVCAQLFRLLQEERERRKLSKYSLAGKTGLAQQTLGYVERGMTSPSFDTIYRMARALEIDLGDLVRRAEKQAKLKPD